VSKTENKKSLAEIAEMARIHAQSLKKAGYSVNPLDDDWDDDEDEEDEE
jgi:hypothetical protein